MGDAELPWEKDLLSLIHQPTVAEIEATRPPVPFIWEDRIPAGRVSIFSGAGGSGKSSVLVGLALARACGVRFLGKKTRPGTTLVISAEDTVIDYMRKVDAWRDVYRKMDPVAIARHLKILPLVGEDYRLVSGRFGGTRVDLERVDRLAVAARCLDPRPDLIILETASRFGAGDENSNESAACFIAACERLSNVAESAVLPVAHVGKSAAREQIVDAYSSRGASAFTDNARSALVLGTISPDRAKRLALTPEEARDLLVLACPKANLAGRSADIVLERVETVHGLVLRPFDGGGMSEAEAIAVGVQQARAKREERGQLLRAVVAGLTATGLVVTFRMLREGQRAALRNIPIREIADAIEQAVADKWLAVGEGVQKGGKILLPGPEKRDQVGSSGITIPLDSGSRTNQLESLENRQVGSSGIRHHPDTHFQVGSGLLLLEDPTSLIPLESSRENGSLGQNGPSSGITGLDPTSIHPPNGLFPNIQDGTPAGSKNGVGKNTPNIPDGASPEIPGNSPAPSGSAGLPWT